MSRDIIQIKHLFGILIKCILITICDNMLDHANFKEINATNRKRNALFQLNTSLLSYVYYA